MNSPRRTKLTCISMEDSIIACRLYLAERTAQMSFENSEFKCKQSILDKKIPDKQESLLQPDISEKILICLLDLSRIVAKGNIHLLVIRKAKKMYQR